MNKVRLGISTCPNDIFIFHALLDGEVKIPGVELEITLADVEELNRGLFGNRFELCKVSAYAALLASDHVSALNVGWALGHGLGPVVLSTKKIERVDCHTRVIAPGKWTTANLLWKLFHAESGCLSQRTFSKIMPALLAGETDLGVCIHEGRFTWREAGLHLFEDLGSTWKRMTSIPLPLGGIVIRNSVPPKLRGLLQVGIEQSLDWAQGNRQAVLKSMRRYAQEKGDRILWAHVDLYVNKWTRALGVEGQEALATLSELASARGLIPVKRKLRIL